MAKENLTALRKAMEENFPDLLDITESVLFANIWKRPGLSPRDRSLITVAALVSTSHPTELQYHLLRAVENGVSREELKEVILHLAFYAGWPAAMTGAKAAIDAFGNE